MIDLDFLSCTFYGLFSWLGSIIPLLDIYSNDKSLIFLNSNFDSIFLGVFDFSFKFFLLVGLFFKF